MISIVSVYSREKILTNYLLKSLKRQTSTYEPILIDNTKMQFKSVAEALNYGGKKAKGKYIMFVHPDVDLSSSSWIEEAEKILDSIPDLGIAGVAGMSEEGHTNKERGRNVIKSVDRLWEWGNPIQKPEPVQTLDECLVIIPKVVFNRFRFDEKVCDSWHLYVVDYCLGIKDKGFGVYAIPMYIYHRSSTWARLKSFQGGSLFVKEYYKTLAKICKKHKDHFAKIYTTCETWSTKYPLILQKINSAMFGILYRTGVIFGLRFLWRITGLKTLRQRLQRKK